MKVRYTFLLTLAPLSKSSFYGPEYAHCKADLSLFDATKKTCYSCGGDTVLGQTTADFMTCCGGSLIELGTATDSSCQDKCDYIGPVAWNLRQSQTRCDGVKDCRYGEDEIDCGTCTRTQFTCDQGATCLDSDKVCDGQKNCLDGNDEKSCAYQNGECGVTEFTCGSRRTGSTMCIPQSQVCDTVKDCIDGSDEVNCDVPRADEFKFRCRSGNFIDQADVCQQQPFGTCGDQSDLKNCFDWGAWGPWQDLCSSMCLQMKFRQCFNKFTGEVDHTLANCPTDDSKHETKVSRNPASYEYSQDLKLCPDMSLPSCTFGAIIQPPELTSFSACERNGDNDEIIFSYCDGQLVEDLEGTTSLGFTSSGKDATEKKKLQDALLTGRACNGPFYCNGAVSQTGASSASFPWWIIIAVVLLLLLLLVLYWFCCWRKNKFKREKMLPVKKINDRVSQDPGYVDTYGKKAPSARVTKLVRNSDLERRVVGSANVATTDNEIRMQKADSDLDDVVRNSETYQNPVNQAFSETESGINYTGFGTGHGNSDGNYNTPTHQLKDERRSYFAQDVDRKSRVSTMQGKPV